MSTLVKRLLRIAILTTLAASVSACAGSSSHYSYYSPQGGFADSTTIADF